MSIITVSIFVLLLAGGCVGSWKGALYWQNRTRDARKEDPRDQEIRELSAALSIARKEAERIGKSSSTQDHEIAELRIKLEKLTEVLRETRQKLDATQENLNKEIEQKSELDSKLQAMHGELTEVQSRNSELEMRVKIDSPTSGLVAGLDDTVEDDEKEVFTIRHEHKILKEHVSELQDSLDKQVAESQRWKQHCTVMTKTNKALRSNVAGLNQQLEGFDEIKAAAEQLPGALDENKAMQAELIELRNVRADNDKLNARANELELSLRTRSDELVGAESQIVALRAEVDELSAVHKRNSRLQDELDAANQQLSDDRRKLDALESELSAMREVQNENSNLKSRIDELQQIEEENGLLRNQQRQAAREHAAAIEQANEEKQQLSVRLEALDNIQAENEKLLTEATKSRQTHADDLRNRDEQIRKLETQCAELSETAGELPAIQADNATLRNRIREFEETCRGLESANGELTSRIDSLSREVQVIPELNARNEGLEQKLKAAAQVSADVNARLIAAQKARDDACAEIEELKLQLAETAQLQIAIDQAQAKFEDLQRQYQEADDSRKELHSKLLNTQSEKDALMADLQTMESAKAQMRRELEELKDKNARLMDERDRSSIVSTPDDETTEDTSSNDDTDRLPILDESAIQDEASALQDDLKAIKGVGAKIEEQLNKLGIVNFKDLAELGPEDCARAAELIPNLESRMKRDNWTAQARELHLAKYRETI